MFEPDTRFEFRPVAPAPFRAAQEDRFEHLKDRLFIEHIEAVFEPLAYSHLRRAANEAAALAWVTPYPLLVFPALFHEKAQAALAHAEKQETVLRRSRELLEV